MARLSTMALEDGIVVETGSEREIAGKPSSA
jgi:hypothetical protein